MLQLSSLVVVGSLLLAPQANQGFNPLMPSPGAAAPTVQYSPLPAISSAAVRPGIAAQGGVAEALKQMLQRVPASSQRPVYDRVPPLQPPARQGQVGTVKMPPVLLSLRAQGSIIRLEAQKRSLDREIRTASDKIKRRQAATSQDAVQRDRAKIDQRLQQLVSERISAVRRAGGLKRFDLLPVSGADGGRRMALVDRKSGAQAAIQDLPLRERIRVARRYASDLRTLHYDQKRFQKQLNKLQAQQKKLGAKQVKVLNKIQKIRRGK
jgi:chorismate mutase